MTIPDYYSGSLHSYSTSMSGMSLRELQEELRVLAEEETVPGGVRVLDLSSRKIEASHVPGKLYQCDAEE